MVNVSVVLFDVTEAQISVSANTMVEITTSAGSMMGRLIVDSQGSIDLIDEVTDSVTMFEMTLVFTGISERMGSIGTMECR